MSRARKTARGWRRSTRRSAWQGVVFLGETNHFVHEEADFRLWCQRRLAGRRLLVVGEKISWSDGDAPVMGRG